MLEYLQIIFYRTNRQDIWKQNLYLPPAVVFMRYTLGYMQGYVVEYMLGRTDRYRTI